MLKHYALLSLFVLLLLVVDVHVTRFDSNELSRASIQIDALAHLNVEIAQEMMLLFTHIQGSSQRLRNLIGDIKRAEQSLYTMLQHEAEESRKASFFSPQIGTALASNAQETRRAVGVQLQTIADFLAAMSRLSDAQQQLPRVVARAREKAPAQLPRINALASNLMQWQLFPKSDLEQEIRQQLAGLQGEALQPLLATITALLRDQALVRQAIREAEQSDIPATLTQVREVMTQHYAHEEKLHDISKLVLEVMVAALLLYLVLLLIAAHRRNLHLQDILDERSRLQERNRLLLAAMQKAPNGILVCNSEGKVLYANQRLAQLHGEQDPDVLVGRYAAELRGGTRGDAMFHAMVEATNQGQSWVGEYTLADDQDQVMTIDRTMSAIDLDDHHYLVGIDRDVTVERERMRKLEATQRLESLGVLAGGIAHDFNNILAAIRGNTMLAMRHDGAAALPYLQRIDEGTQRAAGLCQQMLAYAGKGQFVIEPLDLSALVEDVSQLIAVSIDKQVTLTLNLAEGLAAVEGDRTQLQQVILNLITNASEAITGQKDDGGGEVTITTCELVADADMLSNAIGGCDLQPGRCVALQVADNGCGMDAETLQRIFEPFFTTKFTGRGLGMSAMLGIVQHHHAALLVQSEVGKGSRFCLLLPPTDKPLPQTEPPVADPAHDKELSGLVLLIDDEAVIREMTAEILEDIGLQTLVAEDGERGVELFRLHQADIDAVLLDMTMPNMNGEECFRALRAMRADLPVVVASGYAEQDVIQAFGEGELAGFLHKPFHPGVLQQMMQKIVSGTRRP